MDVRLDSMCVCVQRDVLFDMQREEGASSKYTTEGVQCREMGVREAPPH